MEPVARLIAVVLDCAEPRKLAAFYGELNPYIRDWITGRENIALNLPMIDLSGASQAAAGPA